MRKSSSRRGREQLQLFECSPTSPLLREEAFSFDREQNSHNAQKKVNKRRYWLVKNTPHFTLWFEREHLSQLTDNSE